MPYSLRLDDAPEIPSGSAGSESASRKRQLPARESLSSTDAPMAEPDEEYVEVEIEPEEHMEEPVGKGPQPMTSPSTHMTVDDAAAGVPERQQTPSPWQVQRHSHAKRARRCVLWGSTIIFVAATDFLRHVVRTVDSSRPLSAGTETWTAWQRLGSLCTISVHTSSRSWPSTARMRSVGK